MVIILIMASFINFTLNPAASLMPILVTKHFNGGVGHLAAVDSTFGVGAILGGVILGVWGGFKRRIYTLLMGLLGIGLGFALIGFVPANAFPVALLGMFLAAFMMSMTNGPLMALLQAVVAPEMQGRVFTLIGSVSALMSPLGLLIAGPVANRLGIQAWYNIGGLTCLALGVACFFIPAVTRLEDGRGETLAAREPEPAVAVSVTN
jgi:DHA3 family macrolide efflux protein-like MFS transporter